MTTSIKHHLLFIFTPISCGVLGEFLMKIAVNNQPISGDLSGIIQFITTPQLILGMSCIIGGGVLWIIGLSKFELSYAYPFLSLNYIIILLGSALFLSEKVAINRLIAMLFIIVGLIIISRSPNSETEESSDAN